MDWHADALGCAAGAVGAEADLTIGVAAFGFALESFGGAGRTSPAELSTELDGEIASPPPIGRPENELTKAIASSAIASAPPDFRHFFGTALDVVLETSLDRHAFACYSLAHVEYVRSAVLSSRFEYTHSLLNWDVFSH